MPVKAAIRPPDTPGMSKRALLWMLGLIAFAFTFLAAANVKQYSYGHIYERCSGLSSLKYWFKSYCNESLPPRLGVMALGLAVLVTCGYFAGRAGRAILGNGHVVRFGFADAHWRCRKPGCGFSTTDEGYAMAHSRLLDGQRLHEIYKNDDEEGHTYSCRDCDFQSEDRQAALAHRLVLVDRASPLDGGAGSAPISVTPVGVSQPGQMAVAPPASPATEFKTCPDCAELIRAAARKCRFCGYMFESAEVSG
jgi:Uncharacterised protein family UPF0547